MGITFYTATFIPKDGINKGKSYQNPIRPFFGFHLKVATS